MEQFNLEVYILVENILRTCKEALLWGQSPVEACNKYIEMANKKDVESFEVFVEKGNCLIRCFIENLQVGIGNKAREEQFYFGEASDSLDPLFYNGSESE